MKGYPYLLKILFWALILQTSPGWAQVLQPLISFTAGAYPIVMNALPYANLTVGPNGDLFGSTSRAGIYGQDGVIFELTTNGALTVLTNEETSGVGDGPSTLLLGKDGFLYGKTFEGGGHGYGDFFKLGTNGIFTNLVAFSGFGDLDTNAGVTLGLDGQFYGSTKLGGSHGYGQIFEISTNRFPGGNDIMTTIASFNQTNGAQIEGGLTLYSNGCFYGTTSLGGSNNAGTIFKVTTNGVLTSLHSFSAASEGANPFGNLLLGNDGNFYGTAVNSGSGGSGTIFEITPDGMFSIFYSFSKPSFDQSDFLYTNFDGANPYDGLTLGGDGNFYGTTYNGGVYDEGTVFEITTNGVFTTIHSFSKMISQTNSDGANPYSGLTLAGDGKLYGTTYDGGIGGGGVVFRLNLAPAITGIANSGSGSNILSFNSFPGGTNYLWAMTNFDLAMAQWQVIATNVADINGDSQFVDTNINGIPMKFYRLSEP